MLLCKNTIIFEKKTIKKRHIMAIFSTILHYFRVKILCIVFYLMRSFECWVTHYYQIMISLSQYGLSEYAQKNIFRSFTLNISEKYRLLFEDIVLGTVDIYAKNMNPPSFF